MKEVETDLGREPRIMLRVLAFAGETGFRKVETFNS